MKLVFAVLTGSFALLITAPSFAEGVLSTRMFSTEAQAEAIPETLHFQADNIHVINTAWYNSIFEERGCERALQEIDLPTPIEIKATGPKSLSLSLNGHSAKQIASANAHYVPIHYQNSTPVHPHFLIRLPEWVLLHATIHKSGDKKVLKLSLIQGKGEDIHLVPILEAIGH